MLLNSASFSTSFFHKKIKLVKEWLVSVAAVVGGGATVVVRVKFNLESRELQTWSLMKMAKPGDHEDILNDP